MSEEWRVSGEEWGKAERGGARAEGEELPTEHMEDTEELKPGTEDFDRKDGGGRDAAQGPKKVSRIT
jgi:hypothetical protein